MSNEERIKEVTGAMQHLLLEKNKRYGNAALAPKRRFSKLDSKQGILIRLDDKMNRIESSDELRVNDVCDLIGYLTLLLIAMGVVKEDIDQLID